MLSYKRPREDASLRGADGGEVGKRQRRLSNSDSGSVSLADDPGSGNDSEQNRDSFHPDRPHAAAYQYTSSASLSPKSFGNGNDNADDGADKYQSHGLFVPAATTPSTTEQASPLQARSSQGEAVALICYGMVPQIKCQRLNNTEQTLSWDTSDDDEQATHLPLDWVVRRGRLVVGIESCAELAHMNTKATLVLLEALQFGVEVRPYVKKGDLRSFLQGGNGAKSGDFLHVDANVLGPESACDDVGRLLSKHGVYLQDPQCPESRAEYNNPHVLDLDDVSQVDMWFQELEMELTASKASDNADWNGVLDDLTQQHTFTASAVKVDDAIVKTQIMDHQGEALDFMCKRELGGSIMDSSLKFWQLDRNEDGVPVYRHSVTADEEYQQQPEPQGGILADDMGLGKTLTSISLIACSLDRAGHFAKEDPQLIAREHGTLTRSRATLVVVPSTQLMDSWTNELEKHTCAGSLKVSRYHGHDRVRHYSELLDNDIVITTYGTIATEFRKTRREVLYHMSFFRIVLDEAHTIRSRRTKLFRAVTTLNAAYHWCLTGTPISNKVDDLGALLQFCQVPLLGESKYFQQYVASIARKSIRRGCGVLVEVLKPLCLRRNRALLKIAQPRALEREVYLSAQERDQYKRIIVRSRKAIDDAVAGRTGVNSRNTMLKVLLELRIFCNQGTFTPHDRDVSGDALDADEQLTLMEEKEEAFCAACSSPITMVNQLEDPASGALGRCSHVLCRRCYDEAREDDTDQTGYTCPTCENSTELAQLQSGAGPDEEGHSLSHHSSKLNALTDDLLASQNSETPEKSIVFSVWRKTLNIAADLCKGRGIRFVRIDGKTPQSARSGILHNFTRDRSISTLLMTMGTGALGLNITAASRIHILEPQWNPAVEDQAVGRAVRLGQAKNATVIRYIVKDSVERQIQGYQKRKMKLASGGFEHRNEHLVPEEDVRLNAAFLRNTEGERS